MNEILINNILKEIASIRKKYDLLAKETGGYFNIFEIADIHSDEVKICRILCELLSPTGSHHQGTLYLALFIENVLQIDGITMESLKRAHISREYVIEGNRRIDLVIEVQDTFIPIEVKIYAGDQYAQCKDYLKYARGADLYYLTLHGNPPSDISADNVGGIRAISFKTDILNWIEECVAQPQSIKIAPIRETLLQFSAVIRKLTNQTEERESMEIKKIISASPENMRSAELIKDKLEACKKDMLYKFLKAIEDGVKATLGKEKMQAVHTDYEKTIDGYYKHKGKSTWPSVNYLFATVRPNVEIWFRIEIDWRLWFGLCVAENRENPWKWILTDKEEAKYGLEQEPDYTWWSTSWDYLPNDENSSPNFKESNESFYRLFDERYFDEDVAACVKKIAEKWNEWEKKGR